MGSEMGGLNGFLGSWMRYIRDLGSTISVLSHVFLGCYLPRRLDDFVFSRLLGAARTRSDWRTWGSFKSLYQDMTQEQVFRLELGIHFRYLGSGADAMILYGMAFTHPNRPLAVVLEQVNILLAHGAWNVAADETREAIARLETADSSGQSAEFRVLRMLEVYAGMLSKGSLRTAYQEGAVFREWICALPDLCYSDLICFGVDIYYRCMYLVVECTNWIDDGTDWNVPPTPERSSEASISLLKRYLQEQGNIGLLAELLPVERWFRRNASANPPAREFITWLESSGYPTQHEITMSLRCNSQLEIASSLSELGKDTEANAELTDVEHTMVAFYSSESQWLWKCPSSKMRIRSRKLKFTQNSELSTAEALKEHIASTIKLADEYANLLFNPKQKILLLIQACEKCDQIVDVWPPLNSLSTAVELSNELIDITLDYCTVTTFQALLITQVLSKILPKLLYKRTSINVPGLIKTFFEIFPDFSIPTIGENLTKSAANAARKYGDLNTAKEWEVKREVFLHQANYIQQRSDGTFEPRALDAPDGTGYYLEWGLKGSETASAAWFDRYQNVVSNVLLRWVRTGLSEMTLTVVDAKYLLGIESDSAAVTFAGEEGDDSATVTPEGGRLDNGAAIFISVRADEVQDWIFGCPGPHPPGKWRPWFSNLERRLRDGTLGPSELHRHEFLMNTQHCRVHHVDNSYMDLPTQEIIDEWVYEQRKLHQIMTSINPMVASAPAIETNKFFLAVNLLASMLVPNTTSTSDATLQEVESLLVDYIAYCESTGYLQKRYTSTVMLARAQFMRTMSFNSIPATTCLKSLGRSESIRNQLDMELRVLQGHVQYMAQSSLTETLDAHEAIGLGVAAAMIHGNQILTSSSLETGVTSTAPQEEKTFSEVIYWTQKLKANALSSVFSREDRVPAYLYAAIQGTPTARLLWERYVKIVSGFDANESFHTRKDKLARIQAFKDEIRSTPEIRQVFDVQDGISLGAEELLLMSENFGNQVVFVDFVSVESWPGPLFLLVAYKGGRILCGDTLGVSIDEVRQWAIDQLDPEIESDLPNADDFRPLSGASATRQLRRMDLLIAPLQKCTEPGDTLVFSPTDVLHRIPLHALRIDSQVLIERNPIVYCPSFTMLRLCWMSRFSKDVPARPIHAVFNPLSDQLPENEVSSVASLLNANVHLSSDCSKEQFLNQASEASLLHFHGHVCFNQQDPMQHHLELSDRPESEADVLTAREIFNSNIYTGMHITTISCKSGRSVISPANDAVGLNAAFFYAGASSTICSLWNINRHYGAQFADVFYKSFREQIGDGPVDGLDHVQVVDLAKAYQMAVLAVRKDERGRVRPPYAWAGFVLNGIWLFPKYKMPEK